MENKELMSHWGSPFTLLYYISTVRCYFLCSHPYQRATARCSFHVQMGPQVLATSKAKNPSHSDNRLWLRNLEPELSFHKDISCMLLEVCIVQEAKGKVDCYPDSLHFSRDGEEE